MISYELKVQSDILDLHFHNQERWLGSQAGVNKVAGDVLTAFQAVSGNNAYGAGLKVLDTGDTPIQAGMVTYDFHRLLINQASSATIYKIRIVHGANFAAAVAAGHYTETHYRNEAGAVNRRPIDIMMPRHQSGTVHWVSIWNATNLATLDFFIGLHETNINFDIV